MIRWSFGIVTLALAVHTTPAFPAPVRLWNSGTCPYAQRVWLTLLEKEVPFEHKIVDLQSRPQDFTDLYASINPDPNARAKVPILEHGDVRLVESSVCAEYVAEAFKSQGAPLIPSDPVALAKSRLLQEMYTQTLGNQFALLQAETEEAKQREIGKLEHGLRVLDAFLVKYGDAKGPFLLGGPSAFTLAEACMAPFVQRLLIVVPHFAQVDPLERADALGLTRVRSWLEAVAARPSCVESGGTKEDTIRNYERLLKMMKGQGAGGAR